MIKLDKNRIVEDYVNARETQDLFNDIIAKADKNEITTFSTSFQSLITRIGLIVATALGDHEELTKDKKQNFYSLVDYMCKKVLNNERLADALDNSNINSNANIVKHTLASNLNVNIQQCLNLYNSLISSLVRKGFRGFSKLGININYNDLKSDGENKNNDYNVSKRENDQFAPIVQTTNLFGNEFSLASFSRCKHNDETNKNEVTFAFFYYSEIEYTIHIVGKSIYTTNRIVDFKMPLSKGENKYYFNTKISDEDIINKVAEYDFIIELIDYKTVKQEVIKEKEKGLFKKKVQYIDTEEVTKECVIDKDELYIMQKYEIK